MTHRLHCSYAPIYEVVQSELHGEDGAYIAFGITCRRKNSSVIQTIHDISTEKELVEGMAALFNMCRLPVDCFKDAVIALIS